MDEMTDPKLVASAMRAYSHFLDGAVIGHTEFMEIESGYFAAKKERQNSIKILVDEMGGFDPGNLLEEDLLTKKSVNDSEDVVEAVASLFLLFVDSGTGA